MIQGWLVLAVAIGYIGVLFGIAHLGDRRAEKVSPILGRPTIYALSLGVYCTSWTFFGSVGQAAVKGLDFLTIYIGPILLYLFGHRILERMIRLAKAERITSIADFIAARYGKSQRLAAVVTLIALVGIVPYIALQLKAVSASVTTLVDHLDFGLGPAPFHPDVPLTVALGMAAFACLFGTRHVDATEHQQGLMLAVATESVVKLVSFSIVGIYVTFVLFDGPNDILRSIVDNPIGNHVLAGGLSGGNWIVMTTLSFFAILLLPRMFHVGVVENHTPDELKRARWLFPLYLVAINLFVIPIALGGLVRYGTTIQADSYVLRLPLDAGASVVTVIAFVGGLSAATAMVIVASVALAVMVCNELVAPILVRRIGREGRGEPDMMRVLILVRRVAIFAILMLAYVYHRLVADASALSDIGLLAFAAIAQFAPAFFGALFWRRGTARGAIAGIVVGFVVWIYTLAVPTFVEAGYGSSSFLLHGPFGLWLLRPQALFSLSFDPLAHGVFWSLLFNTAAFVSISLTRAQEPIERLQANVFVPSEFVPTPALRRWRTAVTVDDLVSTVARYLGEDRTRRAFGEFGQSHALAVSGDRPADLHMLRFAEQLLASAIGAASSRLVLSLLVKRRDPSAKAAMKLLDDASAAIQYNRDLLQIALDQVGQGISVFDRELGLICWNRQFRQILDLSPDLAQVGVSLQTIVRDRAEHGEFGPGNPERIIKDRLDRLIRRMETYHERLTSTDAVIEVRTSPMPDGGIVTTWTDITERVTSAEALARANETLERRVRERTEELTRLNGELSRAKAEADEANIGKTRFLAAAGHDILQPLNAARLYATSLVEKTAQGPLETHAVNIDQSLDAVEEILGALLDISRLDAGALKPEFGVFRIDEILKALKVEFEPVARDRGLELTVLPCSLWVRSDRRLLRRLIQNLVSNAIKYTPRGRVLVGARRHRGRISVEVLDTGLGISSDQQKVIFQEFQRLDQGAKVARGLGLGLSIVERISRVLVHTIGLASEPGKGSRFFVEVPTGAAMPDTAANDGAPRPASTRFDGMTVLCLDNEEKILDGMEALLVGWGVRVVKARDQKEASEHLAELVKETGRGPDMLLVDYHLDDGNGIDAVVQLRWRFGSDLPAALITADRGPQVRGEATEKSISILNKPVKPAALRAVLAQWRAAKAAAE
ncbi:MAG: PAS-domain containing protein [Hyphomicrobiales bacterium]|nr:PAS-domain containing protein [Hyphomicrobiales bacterium]